MEKVWRIVYSPALFCSPNLLNSLVLWIVREGIELQPQMGGELDRGYRPGHI
jgi:hypothetical protein